MKLIQKITAFLTVFLLATTVAIAQPYSSTGYFLVLNGDPENTVEVSNGSTLSLTKGYFFEIYNNVGDGWGGFGAALCLPFTGEDRTFGVGGIGFEVSQSGYYVFTITDKGNDNWFVSILRSLDNCTVSDIADKTYTGSAITPEIVVKDGESVLTLGTDYTVEYSNNTNAGTAKVTIAGKGNYGGTVEKTFTIATPPIVLVAAKADPNTTGTYYVTFYDSTKSYVANCEVYYVTTNANGKLTLLKANDSIIKAGEGVILKASSETIQLTETERSTSYTSLLTGSDTATTVENALVLSLGKNGVRFYRYSGTLGAKKAYLTE